MNVTFEKVHEDARLPEHAYGSQHDSVGMDLYAAQVNPWRLLAEGVYSTVINTGLKVQLPETYHLRIASRSGWAFKHNILSYPGTVDNSYRGEIKLKLYYYGDTPPQPLQVGDKVAQGIVFKSLDYEIIEGTVSENTERSDKGFGSSG